jgi:DNA-binding transcriptional MocR family regulator
MYVSGLLQAAALDVVTQPGWHTHLRHMRQHLRMRRDLLLSSLRDGAPGLHVDHVPQGGLNLWVRLPDGTDVGDLVAACHTRGLVVAPGNEWFPAEPAGPYLRLNYSGENPERFGEAGRILGEVLDGR